MADTLPSHELDSATGSGFGASNLVTWDVADELASQHFREYSLRLQGRLMAIGTSRAWTLWLRAEKLIIKSEIKARFLIAASLYGQSRRPRGVQDVLTRNWPSAFTMYGHRHGKLAWKRPPGRPPLTREEYVRRLKARQKKRFPRTGHPGRPRNDGTPAQSRKNRPASEPKVPATKSQRTYRGRHLGKGTGPRTRQILNPDWRKVAEDVIEDAVEELTKRGIDRAKEWVRSLLRDAGEFADDSPSRPSR